MNSISLRSLVIGLLALLWVIYLLAAFSLL